MDPEEMERSSEPGASGKPRPSLHAAPLASFAGAFLGCLATLHLSTLGLTPAIASAVATLLLCASIVAAPTRSLLPATFSSSVFGGSFSGMTPVALLSESVARAGLPVESSFVLLSLFCGLVFGCVCAGEVRLRVVLLKGYGGRFGALAALGSCAFLTLIPMLGPARTPLRIAGLPGYHEGPGHALLMLAACSVGMFATLFALKWPRVTDAGRASRVFVSAAVACAGLVILQRLTGADACFSDAYYAGCFVGMSSPQRLRGTMQPLLAAVTLTMLLLLAAPVLPSVGGSLGLAAFVAVASVDAGRRVIDAATRSLSRPALIGIGRSLATAVAIAAVLLPNDLLLWQHRADPQSILLPPADEDELSGIAMEAEVPVDEPLSFAEPAPEPPFLTLPPSLPNEPRERHAAPQPVRQADPRPLDTSRRKQRERTKAATAPRHPAAAARSQSRVSPPAPRPPRRIPQDASPRRR